MNTARLRNLVLLATLLMSRAPLGASEAEAQPDPRRGLYAIWCKPEQLKLPFIRGGQIHLQWRDVQPGPERYDFTALDEALAEMAKAGRPATVQINGNRHPDFMFKVVPHYSKPLSVQVADKQGTLQYWHPAYRKLYLDLVAAYGRHLRESPHKDAVLGVRLNFNAVGTEHFDVPADAQPAGAWICPPGVEPGPAWRRDLAPAYQDQVIRAFVENFHPQIRVFLRNNALVRRGQDETLMKLVRAGQIGLFHTSSEMEPHAKGLEAQYGTFLDYCRPGTTLGYAEPWADAWGRHGGKTDPRWCPPCQWNYWRLLVDLHCGISFVAIYGADLAHANEPEFRAGFDFAAKYAGYHASPSVAPGAWVALREGTYLKGDYTYLMQRLPGDESRAVSKVGPQDQRYGAWARVVPGGGRARFHIAPRLVKSLEKSRASVRVTYLDDAPGAFEVRVGDRPLTVEKHNSGRWQVAELPIEAASLLKPEAEVHVEVKSRGDLTLHMLEVRRD